MDDHEIVRVLEGLAHEGRFALLQEIAAAGELSCDRVGERVDLARSTISHHIGILAQAEVVLVRREGQQVILSVNHALLDEVAVMLRLRLGSQQRVFTPRARDRRGARARRH